MIALKELEQASADLQQEIDTLYVEAYRLRSKNFFQNFFPRIVLAIQIEGILRKHSKLHKGLSKLARLAEAKVRRELTIKACDESIHLIEMQLTINRQVLLLLVAEERITRPNYTPKEMEQYL